MSNEAPSVRPGGLVTVAFLKARLDEGNDHLGIFMPLIFDVVSHLSVQSFTTADVQEALAGSHGISMPQQAVATLLKRATKKQYLLRESGRYRRNQTHNIPSLNVAVQKAEIENDQRRLGETLRKHAEQRGLTVESTDAALDMLLRFLETEQIVLLLGNPTPPGTTGTNHRERIIVAEFVRDLVQHDAALSSVLRGMLEGLVLYHAAFLPDLDAASRRFKDLRVVFDSTLVRQALGYEGAAMKILMRETIDVLKGSGVRCFVFDKTVYEIRRILALYEDRLGTSQGRASLRSVPMARHFLTERYTIGDVREMSALLEREIVAAGFLIQATPKRTPENTAGEKALAARLADPATKDELQPRVIHDVDCVAGILTLRRGHRSSNLEDARVVFATASPLVIRNIRNWWEEDEHESGIEPVVHIRMLSNLAWLKKPSLRSELKMVELVALCTAALRPEQATWQRFLHHLDSLQKSQKLSSDEVTAVLISAMSDRLLRDAELEEDDPSDIDAVTLDEIVDRVKASYAVSASEQIDAVKGEYEVKLAELETRGHTAAEKARRLELAIEGRARTWAWRVTQGVRWVLIILVAAGALALIVGHPFGGGWAGVAIGIAVMVFIILEAVGILGHVSAWGALIEVRLTTRFRNWLSGQGRDGSKRHDITLFPKN